MTAADRFASIDAISGHLGKRRYITDQALATVIYLAYHLNKPVFLEGEPGVGKTEVALVLADILDTRLIRLQCYEGLERFTEDYGRCLLSDKDVVMIFSDGWDRGEADTLQAQMTLLKRRASKVIWLNPLIKTRDYQPICLGMRTALPYLDYFLPLGNLQDLRNLSRIMKDCISVPSKNRC